MFDQLLTLYAENQTAILAGGGVLGLILAKFLFFRGTPGAGRRLGITMMVSFLPVLGYMLYQMDIGGFDNSSGSLALVITACVMLLVEGSMLTFFPLYWKSPKKMKYGLNAHEERHKWHRIVSMITLPLAFIGPYVFTEREELISMVSEGELFGGFVRVLGAAIFGFAMGAYVINGISRMISERYFQQWHGALNGKV